MRFVSPKGEFQGFSSLRLTYSLLFEVSALDELTKVLRIAVQVECVVDVVNLLPLAPDKASESHVSRFSALLLFLSYLFLRLQTILNYRHAPTRRAAKRWTSASPSSVQMVLRRSFYLRKQIIKARGCVTKSRVVLCRD